MLFRTLALGIALLAAVACAGTTPGSAPATAGATSPPATATSPAGQAIELARAPDNLGCDAIGIDYTEATIHIDPAADPQVWAVNDLDKELEMQWAAGFQGGEAGDPTIKGPDGEVVASDGTVIMIGQGEQTRLAGYFVCASTDTMYVLEADPE